MSELWLRLSALRDEIAWPETPTFALELEPARPPRRPLLRPLARPRRRPGRARGRARALTGRTERLPRALPARGATVELVETLPEVETRRPDFGERVSREEAERRVGFELLDVGEPDAVFARGQTMASLVYGPSTARASSSRSSGHGLGRLRQEGRRHGHDGRGGDRRRRARPLRHGRRPLRHVRRRELIDHRRATYLAGTVLLWNRGPLLLRLEGDLTRAEAVELAESVE